MPDQDVRALERALEASGRSVEDGACDHRLALTRERLRKSTGIVAWWPGPTPPHPSAARVTLTYETKHPTESEKFRVSSHGWALAVAGVEDFFDLGRVARSATFLDLTSGDWFRAHSRRSHFDLGMLRHQEEVTTVDAMGRPRATVRATPRSIDDSRQISFEGVYGAVSALVREESVYDTEWVPWDATQMNIFVNYHYFVSGNSPRSKQWGLDTNLSGSSGSLPNGYTLDVTGISLDLFGADGRPLSRGDHEEAVGMGFLQWSIVQNPFLTWPLRAVATPPSEAQDQAPASVEAYAIERPAPPVFPLAVPFKLREVEQFRFSLTRPEAHQSRREGGFFARVTVSGFLVRARFA